MSKRINVKKKFSRAAGGLRLALTDRSVRLQAGLGLTAVLIGLCLHCTIGEWLAIVISIGLVVTAEIFNTCLERLCDVYTESEDGRIRIIKDMAAGAVLWASLAAAGVGILILIAHLG